MKVSLTGYISTFSAFDKDFSDTKDKNLLEQVRKIYASINETLDLLKPLEKQHPNILEISASLKDMNEFFSDLLLIQTRGAIKLLGDSQNIAAAQTRVKLSHVLAKQILAAPDKLMDKMNQVIQDTEQYLIQINTITLDQKAKIDKIDQQLLASSKIETPFMAKLFGGWLDINVKTTRSVESLFVNQDFASLEAKKMQLSEVDCKLIEICNLFTNFITNVESIEDKFGFAPS